MDIDNADFQWGKLESIPLEEHLIFMLEEDYSIIFILESVIERLKPLVDDVWVRDA